MSCENFLYMDSALLLAKEIIEKNFDEKISKKMLCRKTGLNNYKLKTGFKKLFGVTMRDYQVDLKMEQAKKMLLETDEKISGIAYTVGYQRANSFSLEFKRRVRSSPADFRKNNKNERGANAQ